MKKLSMTGGFAAAAIATCIFGGCSSDPNPTQYLNHGTDKALITLNLSVEHTRAADPNATADETKIKNVYIYIFGEDGTLEQTESVENYSAGTPLKFEVTSGKKSIYAITSRNLGSAIAKGTSIADFEKTTFSSTLTDLNGTTGFLMIGKSGTQTVMKSANAEGMPATNTFDVALTRAVSKVQVRLTEEASRGYAAANGFLIGSATYRICQGNKQMYFFHPGVDIAGTYTDNDGDGCYDNYLPAYAADFISVQDENFTASNCHYAAENIVARPVSGNTTFVSLRINQHPSYSYIFAEYHDQPMRIQDPNCTDDTFYAVGIADRTNGFIDYTIDPATKTIMAFCKSEDAVRYVNALNGGELSAATVSESDTPLLAQSKTRGAGPYELFTFEGGYSYYRINLKRAEEGEGSSKSYKNVRNTFYKIDVKTIKTLGFPSEDMLRPGDPEVAPDTKASAWLQTAFSIEKWNENPQEEEI